MAFKMKGSAFKLGNVATKSALQQKDTPSPMNFRGDYDLEGNRLSNIEADELIAEEGAGAVTSTYGDAVKRATTPEAKAEAQAKLDELERTERGRELIAADKADSEAIKDTYGEGGSIDDSGWTDVMDRDQVEAWNQTGFKMKGSPHKMGEIQGASGHTSALKKKKSTFYQTAEKQKDSEEARKKLMEEDLAKLQSEETIGYEDRAQDERDARKEAENKYADKKAKEVKTEKGEYVPGALKQTIAAESTDMNVAGNIRDAEIADATAADDALIERFKTSQPKIYEKMMKHYEDNTEGGAWDLGSGQQGAHTYRTRPFDHFLGIKETGIDFLDNKLRQGRKRLNEEKAHKVRNKMLDFINETAPESWKSTEEEE